MEAWNRRRPATAPVEIDGALATIRTAAIRPAPASTDSTWLARRAFTRDASPSFSFGVRKKAAWNVTSPLKHASATTQLNANHTRRPAMASLQVQPVLTFIAQTAR